MAIQERKRREKERRRQQIMVAAKKVFLNKGIGKATMEDIAREAEISPGTIYLYFLKAGMNCASPCSSRCSGIWKSGWST